MRFHSISDKVACSDAIFVTIIPTGTVSNAIVPYGSYIYNYFYVILFILLV